MSGETIEFPKEHLEQTVLDDIQEHFNDNPNDEFVAVASDSSAFLGKVTSAGYLLEDQGNIILVHRRS